MTTTHAIEITDLTVAYQEKPVLWLSLIHI